MTEENKEESNDSKQALVNIKITDIFGISKPANSLVTALITGIGSLYAPLERRANNWANQKNYEDWQQTLSQNGLEAKSSKLSIGERTEIRLKFEQQRKQQNRENIAYEAIKDYKTSIANKETFLDTEQEVDLGWLDLFWSLAEKISDEDLQNLWGRILCRQALSPNKISLRALDFLSTMSKDEAKLLESLANITYKIERKDSTHEMGIFRGIGSANRSLDSANDTIYDLSYPQTKDLWKTIGIFITPDNWSHQARQSIINEEVHFSIAKTNMSITASHGSPPLTADNEKTLSLGSVEKFSPLGEEIVNIIHPQLNLDYFNAITAAMKLNGWKIIINHSKT